jgi:peroxiredoxin Q/BCP
MVKAGDPAPDFRLPSDDGSEVSLSDLRGEKVILYFYPRDNTPGCTLQACDLRDDLSVINERGALVLGVSPDPPRSHVKFRGKFGLNFPLLSDEDHQAAKAYGVWKEKSMYGRKLWGIERSTFVIDEEGVILVAWRKVKAKGHAERVKELLGEGS